MNRGKTNLGNMFSGKEGENLNPGWFTTSWKDVVRDWQGLFKPIIY